MRLDGFGIFVNDHGQNDTFLQGRARLTILVKVGGSREEAVLRTSTKGNRIGKPLFRVWWK